jgi:hypothetical protein
MAVGCETGRVSGEPGVFSSVASNPTATNVLCGTSMSTPAVAGLVALFIQDWRALGFGGPEDRPLPALVKAMMIHTARDLGTDGPDFQFGYGSVEARALIDLLREGEPLAAAVPAGLASSPRWGAGSLDHAQTDEFSVTVPPGSGELKASLAWDDPAAAAFAAVALVNDLDLTLIAPDATVHRAWVLDPADPEAPATAGTNSLDNQEQVVVESPQAGTWTVRVAGTTVPSGPQSYGLVAGVHAAPDVGGGCSNLVGNGGFETDTAGWTLTGAARVAAPAGGHGSLSLRLGGAVSTTHRARTEISIPADATRAEWTFHWHQTTDEASRGFGYDPFYAEVRNTSTQVQAVLDSRSEGFLEGQWLFAENLDLLPFAGQTVRLTFEAVNDASFQTSFFVDDVSLEVCLPAPAEIFADGFETGDAGAWDLVVP